MSFCSACGTKAAGAFCNKCGSAVEPSDTTTQPAVVAAKAEEQVFYEDKNVRVTKSRFIAGPEVWTLNNIASVVAMTERRSAKSPAICVGLGLLIIAINQNAVGYGVGGALMVLGLIWISQIKADHHIVLRMASGEKASAVTDKDPEYIAKIIRALNQAIAARG